MRPELEEFYNDWMNNSKNWFSFSWEFDSYIKSKYGHLIDFNFNDDSDDSNPDTNDIITQILIYDQLTRHYYRSYDYYKNHIITYFNRKALKIAEEYKNDVFISNLDYNNWIFYMLVFRHTNEREHLLFVMNEIWKRKELPLKSFIKATYMRANFIDKFDDSNDSNDFDRNILEYNPNNYFSSDGNNNKIIGDYSELEKEINKNNLIILSLSGGVDSVSCLYHLSKLTSNLIAVHINYNNREETKEEVKFLRYICKNLNVKLYVRTITEIKRKQANDNDLRDVYESYTKKIRFNSYKQAFINNNNNNNHKKPIVVLGHNKDDCFENILTNISYKNKYENLKGIELKTEIDGIDFHRPLINVSKNDIYEYSRNNNIPYLNNSTPEWSQRGKIRSSVVPVLEKWDKRIIGGLFDLSDVLRDLHLNLKSSINNFNEYHKDINLENFNLSLLYWKYGIFKLYNTYPSNKSLISLIERFKLWKSNYDKLELHKKTKIIINKNIYLEIWKCRKNCYSIIIYNRNNSYNPFD